jgi:hypothetical protein
MTKYRDIIIGKGSAFSTTFTVTGDLTTHTTAMTGRYQHGLTATVFTGTVSAVHAGGITTFTLSIPSATTAGLSAPIAGVWDMETTTGGSTTRQIEGAFYVTPEVTT